MRVIVPTSVSARKHWLFPSLYDLALTALYKHNTLVELFATCLSVSMIDDLMSTKTFMNFVQDNKSPVEIADLFDTDFREFMIKNLDWERLYERHFQSLFVMTNALTHICKPNEPTDMIYFIRLARAEWYSLSYDYIKNTYQITKKEKDFKLEKPYINRGHSCKRQNLHIVFPAVFSMIEPTFMGIPYGGVVDHVLIYYRHYENNNTDLGVSFCGPLDIILKFAEEYVYLEYTPELQNRHMIPNEQLQKRFSTARNMVRELQEKKYIRKYEPRYRCATHYFLIKL